MTATRKPPHEYALAEYMQGMPDQSLAMREYVELIGALAARDERIKELERELANFNDPVEPCKHRGQFFTYGYGSDCKFCQAESAEARVRELEGRVENWHALARRLEDERRQVSINLNTGPRNDVIASSMRQAITLAASQADNVRLREALESIACFTDIGASDQLTRTNSYSAFDEPGSVETAREALRAAPSDTSALREFGEKVALEVIKECEAIAEAEVGTVFPVNGAAIVSRVLGEPHTGEDK